MGWLWVSLAGSLPQIPASASQYHSPSSGCKAMNIRLTLLTMLQVSYAPFQTRRGVALPGRPPRALSAIRVSSASDLPVPSRRSAVASQLLRVMSGQRLPDLNLTASLARSVQPLDVNLSREGLAAWKVFDDSLCSSSCPYPLYALLSRKVLAVPEDIEHSHCKLSTAPVCACRTSKLHLTDMCVAPPPAHHCILTLRPFGYHFQSQHLNVLMTSLFNQIPKAVSESGLPEV